MSDAFISYRRKPSAPQASLLQEKLKNQHDIDAYLDTTRADSTKVQFPERLMSAIEEAPTFILMLGDTTLESEWVLKEIRHAYELKKHCIPIFQEIYAPTNSTDPAVEYV
ncbi:MAG: toll/interleukin-1 receptor domain-containing protein, partial [Phototrophicales bacterium]|nr:toll/interleukin-1 receptor domain-containing protein [Phototrophicales bacterium]